MSCPACGMPASVRCRARALRRRALPDGERFAVASAAALARLHPRRADYSRFGRPQAEVYG